MSDTNVGGVTYQVTPDYLANAAVNAETTATELADLLAGIRSYVVSLEASWQGVAASSFQQLMQNYDVYAKMLNDSLNGIGGGLRGTYVNYTDAEEQVQQNIVAVDLDLPPANFS
ncbi:WXG100 family type VII secretion target [Micromonospora sp. NBC_01813]|uniref:WXG100 family type VII secretion target n=1 Tax=Micromonospora sp. NBC_01813 TaxID=2975988 RepID=UPI002DD7D66B|nr:WXG100 family type VII secretion target [Micromonospora sp. NBC_01813]WSA12055.1 WXG100 family type VII secretion target [Micromonospora sp. NBC_01813]